MNDSSPTVRAAVSALPSHYASQEELSAALGALWAKGHYNPERLEQLHRAVGVGGRYLAMPLVDYGGLSRFCDRNDAWIRAAVELGEGAVRRALALAELEPRDVDHLYFVTVTGLATPSIDARLVNRLGLRPDVKRTPIFGLGCVAGVTGTVRAADVLRAYPDQVAVLLSVELCSLTLQREDLSVANLIASGLFGDGAAAVVLAGGACKRGSARRANAPRVVDSRAVFYPDTERMMGWDIVEGGFKVVLSAKVPALVGERIRGDVDGFLAAHGLSRRDVRHWVAHTGGPKVLTAFQEALELPPSALDRSWSSLRRMGNLSSASVLCVLADLLESGEPAPGDFGLMLAMGPGFCSELVLLRWPT
jgi:alkylresorcinol/alkylpyrone synthase